MHSELLLLLRKIDLAVDVVVYHADDFNDDELDLDGTYLPPEGARGIRALEESIEDFNKYVGNNEDYYKDLFKSVEPTVEIPTYSDLREKLEETQSELTKTLSDYKIDTEHLGEVRGVKKDSMFVETKLIQELQDFKEDSPLDNLLNFFS